MARRKPARRSTSRTAARRRSAPPQSAKRPNRAARRAPRRKTGKTGRTAKAGVKGLEAGRSGKKTGAAKTRRRTAAGSRTGRAGTTTPGRSGPTRRAATSKTRAASGKPRSSRTNKPSRPRAAKPASRRPNPGPHPAAARSPVGQPVLERQRRRLPDDERLSQQPGESEARMLASARTGHDELRSELEQHTEVSPALTAGDVDAKWQDAYAVGDEAPGGDNPTPDQDRVDDIGKALGVVYRDDEELQGSDKIAERDRHRWEFDPASSDDWPHDKDRS